MFTVMVDFDGSGNSNTRKPLLSLYSVIPSTEVTLTGVVVDLALSCAKTFELN